MVNVNVNENLLLATGVSACITERTDSGTWRLKIKLQSVVKNLTME